MQKNTAAEQAMDNRDNRGRKKGAGEQGEDGRRASAKKVEAVEWKVVRV